MPGTDRKEVSAGCDDGRRAGGGGGSSGGGGENWLEVEEPVFLGGVTVLDLSYHLSSEINERKVRRVVPSF